METIEYKGKKYPIRTLTMLDSGTEFTRTIADETLFQAIEVDEKYLETGTVENIIDNQIYFYVDKGQLELTGEEICKDLLDEEFIFVS